MTTQDEYLAEVRVRVEKLPLSEWAVMATWSGLSVCTVEVPKQPIAKEVTGDELADFIAHARQDIPALLAIIEKQREALEFYTSAIVFMPEDAKMDPVRRWRVNRSGGCQ